MKRLHGLYLDDDLVNRAKELGLNLSQWVNHGLKEFIRLCDENSIATKNQFRDTWNTISAKPSYVPTEKIEKELGSVLYIPITDTNKKNDKGV